MKPAIYDNVSFRGGCAGKGHGGMKCIHCRKPYTKKTCRRRIRRVTKLLINQTV